VLVNWTREPKRFYVRLIDLEPASGGAGPIDVDDLLTRLDAIEGEGSADHDFDGGLTGVCAVHRGIIPRCRCGNSTEGNEPGAAGEEGAMVSAEDVIHIYQRLGAAGVEVWLTGGWGVDALLGEQTRPHKDLDLIMLVDDVARMRKLLGQEGYRLKALWSENRWAVDSRGKETATAFVLQDPAGREIDAHAMRLDEGGNGLPAWEAEGLVIASRDLAGKGVIAGLAVPCFTPEMQMARHTGYELPDAQVRDLEHLHERFGLDYPEEIRRGSKR
jgi:lincosamide nucleotidyltransferase A/C/D/E